MRQRLAVFLAALWWGGISGLSFVAVPVLFARLGAPVAGPVAAQLFSLQCWAGLGIGLALLLVLRRARADAQFPLAGEAVDPQRLAQMQRVLGTMGCVLGAMLLALVQEFGVAQQIVTARATGGDLRLWHGLGTLMVLGQWLCAGATLWRLSR
ncbi:DUF4149 domain-containing protein [Hydrogenophaga sp.]|uniref:DUF4149 domain-containing protein n=1 Tax=Hydrogenophaga sp. TaxID=1904254 RepID=UPI00286D81F4|nr:DUF4149 domain-containing protein [Hydrogenophaga sp.]